MNERMIIFPNLKVEAHEEDEFNKYLRLKGIYLYKAIYDVLAQTNQQVTYKEVSTIIRYDKYLRNKLYIYLSALEEQWRSLIFTIYEYDDSRENILNKQIDIKKVILKDNNEKSNFYFATFNKSFTFNKIAEIIKENKDIFTIKLNNEDIDLIVRLRNKVMHHNLLILSYHQDIEKINSNILEIEKSIEKMWFALDSEYKDVFTYWINNANYKKANISQKPNLNRYCLGVFENGVFNKKDSQEK